MVDEMDWKAAMSSEIFREFVSNELKKEAAQDEENIRLIRQHAADQIRKEASDKQALESEVQARALAHEQFDAFEKAVKASPAMLAKFKQVKATLLSRPDLIEKVDPTFIKGIMMMELDNDV